MVLSCCSGVGFGGHRPAPLRPSWQEHTANKSPGVQQQRLPFGFSGKGTSLRTLPLTHLLIVFAHEMDATGALAVLLAFRNILLLSCRAGVLTHPFPLCAV